MNHIQRACEKFIVRNCRDLCIYAKYSKKGAFTNSVDPDETGGVSSGSALFAMLSTFLVSRQY